MDDFARLTALEREPFFRESAARLGLPPHTIEKDFWVCWVLKELFSLESVKDALLFKGGTSLSKAYGLIRRFSEDVDLSIHRGALGFMDADDPAHPDLSNNARARKTKALGEAARSKIVREIQPELCNVIASSFEVERWSLELDPSDSDGQSLAFSYPRTGLTPNISAYIRPVVKIEFGARADHWPAEIRSVRPFVADAISGALSSPDVQVKVLSPVRTFWEKATILHQIAHLAKDRTFPARYSRHYCDLVSMIDAGIGKAAENDQEILAAVVRHKTLFYRSVWASYETAKPGSLRLVPDSGRRVELGRDLISMREMFFDEPPTLEAILSTLEAWQGSFNEAG